jgi:hypothetical protein
MGVNLNLANYKITINPQGLVGKAANNYVSKVREHLNWIYRTRTGIILLNSIKFHGLSVEIRPYTVGDCNAVGGGEIVGGALRGFVSYSPDTFSLHGACSATKSVPNRGLFWDEILFHELVHVFRNVSQKWNQPPLGFGLHHYTDNEEFIAVLVTNIYISDRTNKIKSGLRADHDTFNPLSTDFDEPFEIFSSSTQVFSLVEQFCRDNPGFTIRVANDVADAAFNPLADYYAAPDLAREKSRNAVKRDVVGLVEELQDFAKTLLP